MAFEFPYNLVAGGVARAAEVMANFNKIKAELDEGVLNIRAGAVKAAALAEGAVGRAALAAGYKRKVNTGHLTTEVFSSFSYSNPIEFEHGLGEVPTAFYGNFTSPWPYQIALEARLLEKTSTHVKFYVQASSPIPGGVGESTATFGMDWLVVGQ